MEKNDEAKLMQMLNDVLEIEAGYFDINNLSSTQRSSVVKKIVTLIKNSEELESDS